MEHTSFHGENFTVFLCVQQQPSGQFNIESGLGWYHQPAILNLVNGEWEIRSIVVANKIDWNGTNCVPFDVSFVQVLL